MTDYSGILSGTAKIKYQRYRDRERKTPSEEEIESRKRKAKNVVRQKHIRSKDNSARLERRRKV